MANKLSSGCGQYRPHTICHFVILGPLYITAQILTSKERLVLFRDILIHWNPSSDNTVTVSKKTGKVLDFTSIRSTRSCSVSILEGYSLCSTGPSNFQLHDLSKATFPSAKFVQFMASCLQKLPMNLLQSCVSYEFSILHSYFQHCLSFQCCHQGLKKLVTKQTNFAQPNDKSITVLC